MTLLQATSVRSPTTPRLTGTCFKKFDLIMKLSFVRFEMWRWDSRRPDVESTK